MIILLHNLNFLTSRIITLLSNYINFNIKSIYIKLNLKKIT